MKAKCHECGTEFNLDAEEGDEVRCPSCELLLRVVIKSVNAYRFETVEEEK
ncbi:hypothetical protein HY992_00775 [Candidatus Micrarchaeota archaeon]|nr:hypothetical protein [Candidatus Micrarchaeota archaeon]